LLGTTTYRIEGPWSGRLSVAPRPRGEDWLADELLAWREAGYDVLVSLLTSGEAEELGLKDEPAAATSAGLKFLTFEIADMGVPESLTRWSTFVDEVHAEVQHGKDVVVHCRGGIGRSGLLAASLLVREGIEPAAAFATISTARGCTVPETNVQGDWLRAFAQR
jgi:protein-tyrosine phosphatase